MWHGKAIAARMFSLALSIGSLAGCEVQPPPQVAKTASDLRRDLAPELRYQVDPSRRRVWILNRDGVFVYDVGTPEKTVVRLPDWLWVGGDYSCLPDLALGPKGEAVITSNIQPTLWRVDPDSLTVSVHPLALDADADKDLGFTGLVYSAGHKAYFAVSDLHGSLWKIDSELA